MGRVRTKTVKRAARAIVEKYYSKMTQDFQSNKRLCDEIAVIQTKRLRNKIAGYATHLMKRIQKGPVRGISLRLQEEERERLKRETEQAERLQNEAKEKERLMLKVIVQDVLRNILKNYWHGARDDSLTKVSAQFYQNRT